MGDNNSIRTKALTSTIWKFMERIGAQLVSMIVSIILARILTPDDYSVVSLVAIFFAFANVFISGGLNTALIQKKEADEEDYSTILYFSIFISLVIYGALFLLAPFIADIYNKSILVIVIRVMGISLPVTAVKSIWCAYISSNLQFKKFFFSTLGGTIFSAVIGIALALNGAGVWALVAQQMSNTFIDTFILICTTRIHLTFKFSLQKFKTLFAYGWKIFVSSIIGTIYTQIIPLIIGVKYSTSDLSFYTKGKSFPELISTTSTNTLAAVMFPTMSKYQDDRKKLLQLTRLLIRISSFIAFPLMLGFFAISENFVRVVLTDKWLPAVPYIKLFCVANMFEMVHIGNCETIKAMGRSDIYLVMEIIKKSCYLATIFAFLLFSKTPVELALAFICCTCIALIVNSIPNRKLLGYTFLNQIEDLLPNLVTAIIMSFAVQLVGQTPINLLWKLVLQVVVGMLVYVLENAVIKSPNLKYLIEMMKEILPHGKACN